MMVEGYYIDNVVKTLMFILLLMSFLIVFYELKKYFLNKNQDKNIIDKSLKSENIIDNLFMFKLLSLIIIFMIVSAVLAKNTIMEFTPENVEKYNLCKENTECKILLIDFYKDGYIKKYEMQQINELNKKYKEKTFNKLNGSEKQFFENLIK